MFPIRCDHRHGIWPVTWACRQDATRYLLHHPVYGLKPDVQLLCEKHFVAHMGHTECVLEYAHSNGNYVKLSALVKDAGTI